MEPRYYLGKVVYLHPHRPSNPGDFVLATVKEPDSLRKLLKVWQRSALIPTTGKLLV